MNNEERIIKGVNELINLMDKFVLEKTKDTEDSKFWQEDFQNIRKMLLEKDKGAFTGIGKWYLVENGVIIHVFRKLYNNEISGYGLFSSGRWFDLASYNAVLVRRELTESEIKQAIIKGCEQHGIVKGATVRCLHQKTICVISDDQSVDYYNGRKNFLYLYDTNGFLVRVFDNGKFAEVVKDFKCDDGNCTTQCDKCNGEEPKSDRELFKDKTILELSNKADKAELLEEAAILLLRVRSFVNVGVRIDKGDAIYEDINKFIDKQTK